MSRFPRVSRGDPFRPDARAQNDLYETVERLDGAGTAQRTRSASGLYLDLIRVENTSTETDIPPLGLIELTGPLAQPGVGDDFLPRPVAFSGKPTSATWPATMIGVTPRGIPSEKSGLVQVYGIVQVSINFSKKRHRYAIPDTNGGEPISAEAGPLRVLWAEFDSAGSPPADPPGSQLAICQIVQPSPLVTRWARITGSTAIGGATNRWTYSATETEATASGRQDVATDPITWTDTLYNDAENGNSASGTQGNQIDPTADAPSGGSITVRAIATGTHVQVRSEVDQTGVVRHWFSVSNGIDVDCGS